jgi:hypothetical protein
MGMKCWNSTFNAQGLRGIIIVIQVGTMKIYVAIMKAFKKKEKHDETQFTTKVDGLKKNHPLLNANVLFCKFFKTLTTFMTKLKF